MRRIRWIRALAMVLSCLVISSCGAGGSSDSAATLVNEEVRRGEELYQQLCASCHGVDLSGAPNWKTPKEDGSYPPPPHDSSGHTWHHSDQVLLEIIRDGSDFPQSRMPTFGDTLSDEDIDAIIDFFKANWGPEERAYQEAVTN